MVLKEAVSKVPKQPHLFVHVVESKVKYSILQKIILLMRQPLSWGLVELKRPYCPNIV